MKNILITWHYTTHGIAYLKHILSAYYKYGQQNIFKQKEIPQEEMNIVFDEEIPEGFVFDKVFYLTAPQKAFDKLSLRRIDYVGNIVEKDNLIRNDENLKKIWDEVIDKRKKQFSEIGKFPKLEEEIRYVQENYSKHARKWIKSLWRDIHHYRVKDQILWFGKYSNAKDIYKTGETFINKIFDINNFRDPLEISKSLSLFIKEIKSDFPKANFVINASLGSNETQVVWHVLSELNYLPQNTTLIQTYDNKERKDLRFKPFIIKRVPSKIVTAISKELPLFDEDVQSESRKLANIKMKHYINSGFSILLLGERGIGKTRLAETAKKENQNFISVNCASFTDNTIAESILFGHVKGSFTDAKEDRDGVFKQAEGGVLFLDEIHHLDLLIQAKLMKAMQTDENNNYTIIPLGGKAFNMQLTIILASNNTIEELRKKLMPDFFDRITQLVIEIPPLRDTKEDLELEFEKIWNQMKFQNEYEFDKNIRKDKKLLNWLKGLDLYGNYRDLQKVAIYYKTFLDFNDKDREYLPQKTPFLFTKNEYEKYISINPTIKQSEIFSEDKTADRMIDEFKGKLANWAIDKYHGAPNAAAHFKELGGKTTVATIYKWKKSTN